jgi:protein TonB
MPRASTLVRWVLASVVAHALVMTLLPGWRAYTQSPPRPLQVELREPPPEITPPKQLPVQAQPKPAPAKPEPKPVRAPQPETPAPPPVEQRAPILTALPETPPAPQAPVVAEQRSAPPPEPPRAPPAPPPPVPASPPLFDAAYLHNPKPAYPMVAMRRGESGTVHVLVLVTKEGRPARVSLQKTSGSPSLDEAALRAVNSWRFVPARKGAEAVEGEVIVPMVFDIKDAR